MKTNILQTRRNKQEQLLIILKKQPEKDKSPRPHLLPTPMKENFQKKKYPQLLGNLNTIIILKDIV